MSSLDNNWSNSNSKIDYGIVVAEIEDIMENHYSHPALMALDPWTNLPMDYVDYFFNVNALQKNLVHIMNKKY